MHVLSERVMNVLIVPTVSRFVKLKTFQVEIVIPESWAEMNPNGEGLLESVSHGETQFILYLFSHQHNC